MLEKTERPEIYKDTKTKTILNKDINKLNEYKQKKKLMQESKVLLDEVENLKKDMTEIKEMLSRIYSVLEEK